MIVGVFVCVFGDCPLQIGPFLPVTIPYSHLISHCFRVQSLLHHSYYYFFFIFLLISLFFILTYFWEHFTKSKAQPLHLSLRGHTNAKHMIMYKYNKYESYSICILL